MSWIDSYSIVTSPYRTYIQVPSHEIQTLRFKTTDVMYESLSYAFVLDTPANRAHIEQAMQEKGIILRFKPEYWPDLENPAWQKNNNIRKPTNV